MSYYDLYDSLASLRPLDIKQERKDLKNTKPKNKFYKETKKMETLEKHEGLQARLLKTKSLPVQVKVVGNATATSKVRTSDLAGVASIACAGQLTDSSVALGVTLVVAPVDADGKFSVILDKAAIGEIAKINQVSIVAVSGGGTATASSSYLSNGHIVIDLDSSVDLSGANTAEIQLIVTYQKK